MTIVKERSVMRACTQPKLIFPGAPSTPCFKVLLFSFLFCLFVFFDVNLYIPVSSCNLFFFFSFFGSFQVVQMLLKLLEDKNGEVQNLAVKWWLCHFLGIFWLTWSDTLNITENQYFVFNHETSGPGPELQFTVKTAPLAQRVTKFREIYMNAFISLNPIEIWSVFTWNIQQNLCYTIIWLSFHSGFSARSGGWENSLARCSVSGIFGTLPS